MAYIFLLRDAEDGVSSPEDLRILAGRVRVGQQTHDLPLPVVQVLDWLMLRFQLQLCRGRKQSVRLKWQDSVWLSLYLATDHTLWWLAMEVWRHIFQSNMRTNGRIVPTSFKTQYLKYKNWNVCLSPKRWLTAMKINTGEWYSTVYTREKKMESQ